MTTASKSLAAALVVAQTHAVSVGKDARNSHMGYRYASAEAIIAEAKEALALAGIAVVPLSSSLLHDDAQWTAVGISAVLSSTWRVLHGESGEHVDMASQWPVVPEKGRPPDKATAAARTASLGYFLRDLLQLPRVEEDTGLDDSDRHDGERYAKSATKAPPAAKAPAPKVAPAKAAAPAPAGNAAQDLLAACALLRGAQAAEDLAPALASLDAEVKRLPLQHQRAVVVYAEVCRKRLAGVELAAAEERCVAWIAGLEVPA